MGIIQRQGAKEAIVRYFFIIFGFINTIFIFPHFLEVRELGVIRFLQNLVILILPFTLLGAISIINRYFTFYKDSENQHNGFLFFVLIIPFIGFCLFLLLSAIFWNDLETYYGTTDILYAKYLHFVIPIVFFEIYRNIFLSYSGINFRIVIPSLINEIGNKIGLPVLVILYYFNYIDFSWLIYGLTGIYGLSMLANILYVKKLGLLFLKPDFKIFKSSKIKAIGNFASYAILGSIGSRLATGIDNYMVGSLIGSEEIGIFSTVTMMIVVIEIPQKAIEKIAMPVIADAWKENNMKELKEIYQKTALIQLICGVWVFLGIWVSIDELFTLMPKNEIFSQGKYVLLILGLAKLTDMATGANSLLIGLSKYYRFNFYAILALAVFNVVTNLTLIPIFQMNGVALATFASLFLFNLSKFLFLKIKLNLNPFDYRNLLVLILGSVIYFIHPFVPSTGQVILDIIINSLFVTIFLGSVILMLNISPELNDLVKKIYNMIINFKT